MTALSNQNATDRASQSPGDLLSALLEESRELTAVERFSKVHEAGDTPAQAKHYRDLIPLTQPAAGQQYAFEVDLDVCSGCKACVSACHHLNGLEPEETWRNVGQLYGENGLPIIQHVTTACHHCVDPGCLNGCPTNAYEKDPETGIVRHLDDQCFGCKYCTMTCPYEVPQYSKSKGIVRKCDMCHGRLAAGEAPACVQACPNQAIKITLVDVEQTIQQTDDNQFLPGTPDASYTHPTTVYKRAQQLPQDLKPADHQRYKPEEAHLPLVLMLVLTQVSVGGIACGALVRGSGYAIAGSATIVLSVLAGLAGLAMATLHLGRPHLAFRSILGWRHSWLSREAIVFGAFAGLAKGAAAFALLPYVKGYLPEWVAELLSLILPAPAQPIAETLAVLAGLAGIYCSAMIYVFTKREFWQGGRTFGRFFGVSVVMGPSLALAVLSSVGAYQQQGVSAGVLVATLLLATLGKLLYELSLFTKLADTGRLPLTAKLMREDLKPLTTARFALAAIGGLLLPLAVLGFGVSTIPAATVAWVAFASLLLGEFAERALYFSAVIPLRMPGGFKS